MISFEKDPSGVIPIRYQKEDINIVVGHSFDSHSYCTSYNINDSEEDRNVMAISDYFVDGKLIKTEIFITKLCVKINKLVCKNKGKSGPPPPRA